MCMVKNCMRCYINAGGSTCGTSAQIKEGGGGGEGTKQHSTPHGLMQAPFFFTITITDDRLPHGAKHTVLSKSVR